MDLEDLVALERTLRQQDTTTRAILGYCLYLEGVDVPDWHRRLSEEFGIDREAANDVLEWLEYLSVLTVKSEGGAKLDTQTARELHSRFECTFVEHEHDQPAQATISEPDQVNTILNVPEKTDFDGDSTIIGSLVDLLAGASRSAVVLNPFYTQVGFELLQEALLAVPKRGASLTLVTRDVCQGTGENRNYISQLISNLESVDRAHQLTVYEFNKDRHDTATFHAKAVIVDRQRAYIGSANITEGSLRSAIELGAVLSGESIPALAETVDKMLNSDLFAEVDFEDVRQQN